MDVEPGLLHHIGRYQKILAKLVANALDPRRCIDGVSMVGNVALDVADFYGCNDSHMKARFEFREKIIMLFVVIKTFEKLFFAGKEE